MQSDTSLLTKLRAEVEAAEELLDGGEGVEFTKSKRVATRSVRIRGIVSAELLCV